MHRVVIKKTLPQTKDRTNYFGDNELYIIDIAPRLY
jgi:hypothetical protein